MSLVTIAIVTICNDIKYYVTLEQAKGRKELTRCLGCWRMEQMARELNDCKKYGPS